MSSSPAGLDHAITEPRSRSRGQAAQVLAVVLIVLGCTLLLARNFRSPSGGAGSHKVPQNAAMEDMLGIRITQVAVVGDGGLLTLTYTVLDPEKASKFQSDVTHPPIIKSERRKGSTSRVSLMKQGHSLRAGANYYLIYDNPADLVRHNETIEIDYGQLSLKHVPVW